jgi:exosortase A-associated hydrolase 1
MTTPEAALSFACAGEPLLGVLSPAAQPGPVGVVIVVGGPQYRVGSHRQFVQLARALAQAGFPVLRFDCRGMGDSPGTLRSFEHAQDDIGAAIGALQAAQPAVQGVVLWGLCDGASAALLYMHDTADPRVAGLALLNPWVRSEASLARTQLKHYYTQRLKERDFWRKLVRGRVALGAVTGLLRNLRSAFGGSQDAGGQEGSPSRRPYQDRMALAWTAFTGPTLLMLSELDLTAREFTETTAASPQWQQALGQGDTTRVTVAGADHTCSSPTAQRAVEAATVHWLRTAALTLPRPT